MGTALAQAPIPLRKEKSKNLHKLTYSVIETIYFLRIDHFTITAEILSHSLASFHCHSLQIHLAIASWIPT